VKRLLACAAALVAPALILASSCSTNSLTAKGGTCFQTIDCQDGLICKYENDAGMCTDDLTGLNPLPEAASDAPALQDSPNDAPVSDAAPPQDTGVKDTAPPQDTGTQDTGTQDTGTTDSGGD
jgi:hypothetical protein